MKVRLADLEFARSDPRAYVQTRGMDPPAYGGLSTTRALQYAMYEFHKKNENIEAAIQHLESMYHRNFKKTPRLDGLKSQLLTYAERYWTSGLTAVEWRKRLSIQVDDDLLISGELFRVDLANDGGYRAWMFGKAPFPWQEELRGPVLQHHIAKTMGVPCDLVGVGFYFTEVGQYQFTSYSEQAVLRAMDEAHALGKSLQHALGN